MNSDNKNQILVDIIRWLIAAAVSFAIIGCCSIFYKGSSSLTVKLKSSEEAASAGTIEYKNVDAPETSRDTGVIAASEWADIYPEIVESYEANSDNNYRVSYLDADQDPYLVNIYEGYGFAKDYTSAIGHSYCLEDVKNTERPHALANCLTCKTADYTALVNDMGTDAYSLDFEEVAAGKHGEISENVGCYNCHENKAGNAGELVVTHDYLVNIMNDESVASVDPATLSCGQCHIEYYFDPDTKATSVPYTSVSTMNPEEILAYYDSIGFSDWTQESTGTGMLKAQHPEMETFLGEGSKHASLGLDCASCHMEIVTSDSGVTYTSHFLTSPLESESILTNTCATCHPGTDMAEKVHTLQDQITAREKEIGNSLSEFKDKLAEAVSSGDYTEAELDEIRTCCRGRQITLLSLLKTP